MIGKQVLAFAKSEKSEFINMGFLLPHREGVKAGAILGGLRKIGRDHMYAEMACVPCKDSDQPGHPHCLIRVFIVCSIGSKGPKLSSCGQRRLIRLGGFPG